MTEGWGLEMTAKNMGKEDAYGFKKHLVEVLYDWMGSYGYFVMSFGVVLYV